MWHCFFKNVASESCLCTNDYVEDKKQGLSPEYWALPEAVFNSSETFITYGDSCFLRLKCEVKITCFKTYWTQLSVFGEKTLDLSKPGDHDLSVDDFLVGFSKLTHSEKRRLFPDMAPH